jgi:L-iditol 2-dehydrogenase
MALSGDVLNRGTLREVPSSMDPGTATLTEPLSSVVNAQEKGAVGPGDAVVIIGAGPIGALHLYLARARRVSRIIVTDISRERLALMEADPADELIHAENPDPVAEVRRLTGGLGASVVITANPVPETQVQAVEMARKGGRILLFGGLPPEKARPGINMNTVHYGALHLIGTTIFAPRHHAEALRLLAEGEIPAGRIISHTFPLDQFSEGAKLALAGRARKVVFTI